MVLQVGKMVLLTTARIISERDFQTIHLKIITPKKAFLGVLEIWARGEVRECMQCT